MYQRPISKDSKISLLDPLSSYKNITNKYKFRSILNGIDRLSTLPTQNLKNNDFEVTKPYFFTIKGRCDIVNCKCQYHRLKRPFGSQHITHHKKSIKQKHNFANRQQKIPIINSLNRKKMQRTTIPSRLVKDKSHQKQQKSHKQYTKKIKLRQKLQNWNESFEQFLKIHDLQILKQRKKIDNKSKQKQSKQLPQNIIIKLLKNNLHKSSNQIRLMLRQLCMDNSTIQHYLKIFEKMKSNYQEQRQVNKQNFGNNLQNKITKKSNKPKDGQHKDNRNIKEEDEFQQQKKKIVKNMEGKNENKIASIIKNLRKSDLDKLKLSLAEFIKSLIANNQQNQTSKSSETMTQFLADFTRIIFGETKKVRRVQSKMKNIFRTKQKEEAQPDIILEQSNADQNQMNCEKNYLRPQSQKTKAKGSNRSLLGSYRLSSKVDPCNIDTSLNRVSVSSIDSSNEDLDYVRATKKTKKTYKTIKFQQDEDQTQLLDMVNWQNYNQLELQPEYQNTKEVQILPKTEKTEEILSKFHKYNNKRLATIFDLQIQRNRKIAQKIQKILKRCGFQKTIIQQYDGLVTVKRKIKVLKEISEQSQFKAIQQQFQKYLHMVEERYYFGKYKTILSKKTSNNNKNISENDHEHVESLLKQLKQNNDNELKHYFLKQVPLKNPVQQEEILLSFPSNLSHIINQQKPIKAKEIFIPYQRKQKQTQVVLIQKQLDDKLQEMNNENLNYKIFNPNKISLSLVQQNRGNCKNRRQSIKKCFRFTKQNYPDAFKDLLHLAHNSKTNSLFDMSIS